VVAASVRGVSATETTLMVAGEPAGQGISAATATLLAGGLAVVGTLLGVVVGLMVEYLLRRRGELRIDTSPQWGKSFRVDWVGRISIRFFNDRDVNISLWDAQVEFYRGAELIGSLIPTMKRWDAEDVEDKDKGAPIDLESRKSLYLEMVVDATDVEGLSEQASSANRMAFVATRIPGGKKVRKSLPLWDDAVRQFHLL
jgi:hypothetical protein